MITYNRIRVNSGLISLGNTGARLRDSRATYIKILNALVEFRKSNSGWSNTDQTEFGELLGELGVFEIKTDNVVSSDKDVRVKTGFVNQLGFTNENRMLTEVGYELLKESNTEEINEFDISNESFVYFKQFLKYQHEDFEVIPLLSLIYSIIEFNNELPIDFITYIWSGSSTKDELIQNIYSYKKHYDYKKTIYESLLISENTEISIINTRLFLENYQISDNEKLKTLLYSILPHGKGDSFKDKTIKLFQDIFTYWLNKDKWNHQIKKTFIIRKLKNRYKDINSKKSSDYQEFLFNSQSLKLGSDWNNIINFFENTNLISSVNEEQFIVNFHIFYMYIKKLSVCEEYRDLNTRHLKLLDVFIFEHDKIKLDLIFWYLFKLVKNDLLTTPILPLDVYKNKLESTQKSISEIYDFLSIDIVELTSKIAIDFPEINSIGLQNFTLKKKEDRFLDLLENVFTKDNIVKIFENIYPRNDNEIRKIIKDLYSDYDATIPALFEYLLGISLYWISQKQFKISSILSSGLDSNLLPKSHAPGGKADVVVRCKNKDYLIEATLSENDGQRKMEAEPVPRHLARHILDNNPNSLALFVAGQLEPNNLVVLRNYKFSPWYSSDGKVVESMDILPLSISNMIYLLKNETNFEKLEKDFEDILNSETRNGKDWYLNEINKRFLNGN